VIALDPKQQIDPLQGLTDIGMDFADAGK